MTADERTTRTTKPKKTYDAARTKELILDAAEQIFAEQGYSAARIDAIAKASGYNKSLIYQYYQDKLGLYTEVVKRADQQGDQMLVEVLSSMAGDEPVYQDAAKFRRFLEEFIRKSYQFLLDHPSFLKIYAWEVAEGWKTWNQITYRPDDASAFDELTKKAKENGILRADLDPLYFSIFMNNVVLISLNIQRFYGFANIANDEQTVEHTKRQIARFVINGLMAPSHLQ